ncbi:MAG TPA: glycosyltransferase family 39 protein, partial [Nitrosopumilaceae archaeon]|nr:glycosyltransferase family 39 protein [Nitrosopumilaceae archaeon]
MPNPSGISGSIFRSNTLIFFLVFILHLVFKSFYLNDSGFWYDETFGLYFAHQDWGHIKHTADWDINPPLYYYLLWIWRHFFGIGEFAIRYSSVLFSALAAGMLYVFTAKNFNKLAALIAILTFTFSNEAWFYSHEARCYSLILFLVLCSSSLYFELLHQSSKLFIFLLGLVNFLLIYTHYISAILLFFQAAVALIYFNKTFFKRIGISILITMALTFIRFTKKQVIHIFHHEKSFWLEKPELSDLKTTFFDFFNGKDLFFIYLTLVFVALVFLLCLHKFRDWKKVEKIKMMYILLCG